MMRAPGVSVLGAWLLLIAPLVAKEPMVLEPAWHHLRSGSEPEWDEFPGEAEGREWSIDFSSQPNSEIAMLRLRQQDVKQRWQVVLNDRILGELVQDENDLQTHWPIPPGTLVEGRNRLAIAPATQNEPQDDIRVGEVLIEFVSPASWLEQSQIKVQVFDEQSGALLPARITIQDLAGALVGLGSVEPRETTAVRTGTVYTATGEAEIHLPRGRYRITAGRGFEYSIAQAEVETASDQDPRLIDLTIRREVATEGYVALDPHIHSLSHSGHGDATVEERMVTLAAEGIELPIATDHNVAIDHHPFAEKLGVRRFFTPVIGNEVTTPVGHFDVFPVLANAPLPDHQVSDWKSLFDQFDAEYHPGFVILNHARDRHSGVRPFGPKRFNAVTAEQREGWPYRFDAMEVINSSATQSDPLQLLQDWMALLSRGHAITPIGSSDSHDVLRHFVGQGRTYVRCDDTKLGEIDIQAALMSLRQGKVQVSYGLLVSLEVDRISSGETLKSAAEQQVVKITVQGPHWISADQVTLYLNGQPHKTFPIDPKAPRPRLGVIWEDEFVIRNPGQDVHLVAIATGPGLTEPYWRAAKPYQPVSRQWKPTFLACSGALWWDANADGNLQAPHALAKQLLEQHRVDLPSLIQAAGRLDCITSAHLAELIERSGDRETINQWNQLVDAGPEVVREGSSLFRRADEAGIRAELDAVE